MAVKIRLARGGAKKKPYYRIVVADQRAPRDGNFIEKVGTFDPMLPDGHERKLVLNKERLTHWLSVGAQPTDRVRRFLFKEGLVKEAALKKEHNLGVSKKGLKKLKEEQEQAAKEAREAKKAAAAAAAAAAAESGGAEAVA